MRYVLVDLKQYMAEDLSIGISFSVAVSDLDCNYILESRIAVSAYTMSYG